MIGKLRIKFILINMIFISSILAAVLLILFFSHVHRLERQQQLSMLQALDRHNFRRTPSPLNESQPPNDFSPPFSPIFVISLNNNGTILEIQAEHMSISQDLAEELTEIVQNSSASEGVINSYSLRYLKASSSNGTKIAFSDQSYAINSYKNLALICILTFFIACGLFFILSLFLSRWALKPVEHAWEQQNQFIADASHELKTPLTIIMANLQILVSHKKETIENQFKWVENTNQEASRMRRLVEELLFLARSDSQSAKPAEAEKTTFDLSDSLWNSTLLFESVAFEKKVTVTQTIASNIFFHGNESRIKQAINILLDNACKYAGRGGSVHISLEKIQGQIKLSVTNNGQTIPLQEQSLIFDRFYRADKSRARKEGGFGLGLPIAKTIIENHRGKITVSSDSQKGTIFTISLPG